MHKNMPATTWQAWVMFLIFSPVYLTGAVQIRSLFYRVHFTGSILIPMDSFF